ncbi:hypothetical protein GN244_ATG07656 [Phytophthora infestans]|uniref:Uncharacterized protein n=1 Tax=Phytophthora infestans TaxID=4787 RepID=A0A833SZI0_PHYIN|nr:hypothetical protein GN244_ATG07655 [Phytophthora infestans]KAF4040225.1 hypothetical protein GN244_ATG07656 [Phytophthora infestans]KAF4145532.1 hypothetical protein GN958_ATG05335 [Phytophthora infestans]KAF4145533.1 hypothetical protein GN958_ATG05336 [Phytophthora infestans]
MDALTIEHRLLSRIFVAGRSLVVSVLHPATKIRVNCTISTARSGYGGQDALVPFQAVSSHTRMPCPDTPEY